MKILVLFLFSYNCWSADCLTMLRAFESPRGEVVKYAKHLQIYRFKRYSLMVIGRKESYLFASDKSAINNLCPGVPKFEIPFKRLVVTSTTHLPPLEVLGGAEQLVGLSSPELANSPTIAERVAKGKIEDTGYPLNPEKILAMNPDIVVTYSAESKELEGVSALERVGLPVITNMDFMEESPLARAEWIKFFGVLIDKESEAEQIFQGIESSYLKLRKMAKSSKKPLVVVGQSSGEIWFAPGAKSDFVQLLKDAGAEYLWEGQGTRERMSRNIEEVFSKLRKVDYWFPQNSWNSTRDALNEDSRYKNFALLKKSYVFNCNKKVNKNGGNDYWETAMMRPDHLLADLIHIFHPEILPDHKLVWYKLLK